MAIGPSVAIFTLLAAAVLQPALAQDSPRVSSSLKTGTQLVVLDVVVTDSKQNPVHSLSASDFTVFENNTTQRIKSFEEHISTDAAKSEPPLVLPPGNFTNYTSVPANAPVQHPPYRHPQHTERGPILPPQSTSPFSQKLSSKRSSRHLRTKYSSLASAAIHCRSPPAPGCG